MNYVEQREAELKRQYEVDMWWIRIGKVFNHLGEAMRIQREIAFHQDELNKIRAQYVRKGRKPGFSPKKAA